MGNDTSEQEEALLRLELARARKVVDAALEGWAESSRIQNGEILRVAEERDQANQTIRDMGVEMRDAKRRLAVHENHNNPPGRAAAFSGRRKRRSNRPPPS